MQILAIYNNMNESHPVKESEEESKEHFMF